MPHYFCYYRTGMASKNWCRETDCHVSPGLRCPVKEMLRTTGRGKTRANLIKHLEELAKQPEEFQRYCASLIGNIPKFRH